MKATMKSIFALTLSTLITLVLLCGCNVDKPSQDITATPTPLTETSVEGAKSDYSDADTDTSYDAQAATCVNLSDFHDNIYEISAGGTYIFTGEFVGQLAVNAPDDEKVHIVLDNATISCETGPAIYVQRTDKLTITLADSSENTLCDGTSYVIDDEGADGAIYSKSDLSINGTGTLTVTGNTAHGIVSKDDFVMVGGTLNITAVKDCIRGSDSVCIGGGTLNLVAGSDGIVATNTDDTEKGYIVIDAGTFTIHAQTDGIQAVASLNINGGTFEIQTGDGSADLVLPSDAFGGGFQGGGNVESNSVSQKGIKSDGTIVISAGDFSLDTVDDAIHAGSDITLQNVSCTISTGDDAIHSDANLHVINGTYMITKCYEGFEGLTVTVDDGILTVTSSDDGINTSGGTDSSGFGGFGFGGFDNFAATEGCDVTINGGTIEITSQGDCIDANGNLTINGGVLKLNCGGNGNTALDCSGTYSHNGGDITTNDGSESNGGGHMGGGQMGGDHMGGGHMGGGFQGGGKRP